MVTKEKTLFTFDVKGYPAWMGLHGRMSISELKSRGCGSVYIPKAAIERRFAQAYVSKFSVFFEDRDVFLGRGNIDGAEAGFAELDDVKGGRQIAAAVKDSSGVVCFNAGVFKEDGSFESYLAGTSRSGKALFLALAALGLSESEAKEAFTKFVSSIETEDADKAQTSLIQLSSNLYYRSKLDKSNESSLQYDVVNTVDVTGDGIDLFYTVTETLYGAPQIVKEAAAKATEPEAKPEPEAEPEKVEAEAAKPEKATPAAFPIGKAAVNPGDFNISERELTKEEQILVPAKDGNFIWAKWMVRLLQKVISTMFAKAFRNILLIGEAGCGKSKFSTQFAMAVGRPFQRFVCGPDTTQIDILGSILPKTGKEMSLDDVLIRAGMEPVSAIDEKAEKIRKDLEADPENAALKSQLAELVEKGKELTNKGLAEMKKLDEGDGFVFQKSPIIRAIENGWVVEIQEPTVIKRASVLVSLNALLEDDLEEAQMTLTNGEVVQRHKDAVVIMTANPDYIGCSPIQQSVLSRMQIVKRLESPEEKVVVQRLGAETGCKDKKALLKIAKVVAAIKKFCSDSGITDGIVGMREASAWVKSSMEEELFATGQDKKLSDESLIRAAFDTVLFHSSQNEEDIEAVISGPFEKTFNLELVEKLRKEANQ